MAQFRIYSLETIHDGYRMSVCADTDTDKEFARRWLNNVADVWGIEVKHGEFVHGCFLDVDFVTPRYNPCLYQFLKCINPANIGD